MNAFKKTLAASAWLTTSGAAALLATPTASAHEFWLEPTSFRATAGTPIGVYVCNGSGYEGWSLPRDARRLEEFVAVGSDGSHPVVGLDGAQPAGVVRLTTAGGYVVAYQSNRAMTVQSDDKFDEYLREKGLDAVLARRIAEGHRGGRVRESYSRYAKALVRVDGEPAAHAATTGVPRALSDRSLGLPLELVVAASVQGSVAEKSVSHADGLQTFYLLYLGKPLAGALVAATRPGTTDTGMTARTDRDGRVQFKLDKRGTWRIAAVHMVAPPTHVDADWDSLWASLTFELSPSPVALNRTRLTRDERCRNQLAPAALQAQR
jgi:hypothetical protein